MPKSTSSTTFLTIRARGARTKTPLCSKTSSVPLPRTTQPSTVTPGAATVRTVPRPPPSRTAPSQRSRSGVRTTRGPRCTPWTVTVLPAGARASAWESCLPAHTRRPSGPVTCTSGATPGGAAPAAVPPAPARAVTSAQDASRPAARRTRPSIGSPTGTHGTPEPGRRTPPPRAPPPRRRGTTPARVPDQQEEEGRDPDPHEAQAALDRGGLRERGHPDVVVELVDLGHVPSHMGEVDLDVQPLGVLGGRQVEGPVGQ